MLVWVEGHGPEIESSEGGHVPIGKEDVVPRAMHVEPAFFAEERQCGTDRIILIAVVSGE